jgi:hypothetical protein
VIAGQEEQFAIARHEFVETCFNEVEFVGEITGDNKDVVGEIGAGQRPQPVEVLPVIDVKIGSEEEAHAQGIRCGFEDILAF